MRQINCIHIESRVPLLKERKFSRKVLPPDRRFSAAREQMKARRELAKYNRVARQVNALLEKIESGHESTKALAEWANANYGSLPDNIHAMLRFFAVAHDSAQKEFCEAHRNFVVLSEIIRSMSEGAHVADPSLLAAAIESGKEAARLGSIVVQTRENFERKVGQLQAKITAPN